MKAILIVPKGGIVIDVDLPNGMDELCEAMRRRLNCKRLAAMSVIIQNKVRSLYYDDDGRVNSKDGSGFMFGEIDFLGRGLIFDFDEESGEEKDVSCSVQNVKDAILMF